MYCDNCDYEGKEGEYLCKVCGGPLQNRTKKFDKTELQARVRQAMKDSVKSPLFIAAIALYTLSIIVGFYADMDSEDTLMICNWLSVDVSLGWLVNLINFAPRMVMTVGLWMLFAEAFRKNGIGTVALTVLMAAEVAFLAILPLLPVGVFGALEQESAAEGAYGVAWLVIGGGMIFAIILGAKKIGVLRTVKETATAAIPNANLSMFVGVLTLIAGGSSLTGLLKDFNLGDLLTGAATLLFGIQYFVYRSAMADMEKEFYVHALREKKETVFVPMSNGTTVPVRTAVAEERIPTWKRIQMEQSGEDEPAE